MRSSSWVHIDGKSYWENYTDAPLPRRERTIRSDYNVLNRGNRHEIREIGWVHDQNNKKIVRSENKDLVIAMEKGYNTYKELKMKNVVELLIGGKKTKKNGN